MARFILIDHSIVDLGGHHCEYAVRVLRAAADAGYEPVLATNQQFVPDGSEPWPIHPVYRNGFWGGRQSRGIFAALDRTMASVREWLFLRKASLVYSPLGIFWETRHHPIGEVWKHVEATTDNRMLLVLLVVILYFARLLRAGYEACHALIPYKHYLYGVWAGLWNLLRCLFSPLVLLVRHRDWITSMRAESRQSRAFGDDTGKLFRRIPLEKGDLVFIPTLGDSELAGLVRYFGKEPRSKAVQWHLVFRRNIYRGRESDYPAQDESLRPLRNAFRSFLDSLSGQEVFFYTDTKQLTQQYNRLGTAVFRTLPIPVSLDYRPSKSTSSHAGPLRVVYVGDARPEKGYHFLPRLVGDLWSPHVESGQVVFSFQSNFNIRGGEPAAAVARVQLETYSPDKVQLFREPLSTQEYRDLVLSGDIALVLYDRDNYYARSSGIFVEALVAGIPVVVPAASWMASQLSSAISQYHEELRHREPIVKARACAELRWRIHGSPETNPMLDAEVTLAGHAPRYCWLVPPASATHLVVSFRQVSDLQGLFTNIYADQLDRAGKWLGPFTMNVSNPEGPCSALIPLLPGVRKIWLGFRGAFNAGHPMRLADIHIDFLAAARPLPVSAVGVLYTEPEEISPCLAEVIKYHDHYRATARAFSKEWSAYHNPSCLVDHLTKWTMDVPLPELKKSAARSGYQPKAGLVNLKGVG